MSYIYTTINFLILNMEGVVVGELSLRGEAAMAAFLDGEEYFQVSESVLSALEGKLGGRIMQPRLSYDNLSNVEVILVK